MKLNRNPTMICKINWKAQKKKYDARKKKLLER